MKRFFQNHDSMERRWQIYPWIFSKPHISPKDLKCSLLRRGRLSSWEPQSLLSAVSIGHSYCTVSLSGNKGSELLDQKVTQELPTQVGWLKAPTSGFTYLFALLLKKMSSHMGQGNCHRAEGKGLKTLFLPRNFHSPSWVSCLTLNVGMMMGEFEGTT